MESVGMKQEKPQIKNRNQAVECGRLIGSFLIIFAHLNMGDVFGKITESLAGVVVPYFFALSGYFAYQAGSKKIWKRTVSLLKLNLYASLLYLVWNAGFNAYIYGDNGWQWIAERFTAYNLSMIFIIGENPIQFHLWYLTTSAITHMILWVYVRWKESEKIDYKPLYIVSVCLYSTHILLGSMEMAARGADKVLLYRNVLFYGIPMITLGIFLREYQSKIISVYGLTKRRLIAIIGVGMLLSIIQSVGTGNVDMPVGAFLEVIALVLLLTSMPVKQGQSRFAQIAASRFGTLSVYIYVTHLIWINIYYAYIKEHILQLGDSVETKLAPFVVLGMSLVTGILWEVLKSMCKQLRRK